MGRDSGEPQASRSPRDGDRWDHGLMDIPTSREREDLERLEALYDATDGGRTEAGPPAALEPLGVAHDDAYLWMRDASRRGLVEVDEGVVPQAKPSSAGRDLVERARQRRADRAVRRRGAASQLLAWSDSTGGNVAAFIASEYGWVDGQRLTFDEAVDAARTLDGAGLIKARTPGAWGLRLSGATFRSCPPDVIAWTSTMATCVHTSRRNGRAHQVWSSVR